MEVYSRVIELSNFTISSIITHTHNIERGADLRVVQEMLGHESILTTEIYTHIDTATWQAAILAHHPRK